MGKAALQCFKHRFFSFLILIFFALITSISGWSQKKELTPSSKLSKIAWINPTDLRKGYIEYQRSRDSLAADNKTDKASFDKALRDLDQQTTVSLHKDSASGNTNRQQIINNASAKRSQLTKDFQNRQKNRNDSRVILNRDYERRIVVAIESVVNEGGFTEVKPLTKGTAIDKGTDVTALVLKKLNRN